MNERINVTKSFLPDLDEFIKEISPMWESHHLTNSGPLEKQLEHKIKEYLNVPYVCLVSNGTLALQLAIRAMNLKRKK